MTPTVEVFADITCPFTHVGLKRVVADPADIPEPVDVHVRAWPLEWVNGRLLDADAVEMKAGVLADQLGVDDFSGFDADRWPSTTLPALNLAAAAYERDAATGLAVSLELRVALFERGLDISDPAVLADIAAAHDLELPMGTSSVDEASAAVHADYDDGRARGVRGSPHFFYSATDYFCPALEIGHDASGGLTARFDPNDLDRFLSSITSTRGDTP